MQFVIDTEDIASIIKAEVWDKDQNQWHQKEFEIKDSIDENERVLILKNLEEKTKHDIRIVKRSDGKIVILSLDDIETKGT